MGSRILKLNLDVLGMKSYDIVIKPVSSKNWTDFEVLFEARGGPSYCWCMPWRMTREEQKDEGKESGRQEMCMNKRHFTYKYIG
jgi:hypothetical protein